MAETQFLSVIRIWAAVAWADGVVKPAEAIALRRLIAAADLSDEQRTEAEGFVSTRVELDTRGLDGLGADTRDGVYRAACRLAAVDREVADVERAFLARLQEALGIADHVARDLEIGILGARS